MRTYMLQALTMGGIAMNGRNDSSLAADVFKGMIAGAVGTWAMGKVTSYWFQHESPETRREYEEVTGGKYPPMRMAEKIEGVLGVHPSEKQHMMLAQGSHWLYGMGAGALYALARRRFDAVDAGQGLAYGAAFSLAGDELMTPLMGLAEPPQAYPWQAHARGFAGHLAYGLAVDTTLDVLDQVA